MLLLLLWFQPPQDDPGARLHAWEDYSAQEQARQIYEQIAARVLAGNHAVECYQKARAARQAFDSILARGSAVLDIESREEARQAYRDWARCEGLKL